MQKLALIYSRSQILLKQDNSNRVAYLSPAEADRLSGVGATDDEPPSASSPSLLFIKCLLN